MKEKMMRTTNTTHDSKNGHRKRWDVHHTSGFYSKQIGSELYEDKGSCIHEGIKNACAACMEHGKWTPETTRIELSLVKNHPLAHGSSSLVIMDGGRGFTDDSIRRFCQFGQDDHESDVPQNLVNQKRMGKSALFGCNKKSTIDYDSGFWLISRTSSRGRAMLVEITPRKLAENNLEEREIGEDATELGAYRNFKGSFSIFVIPNSVFDDDRSIRDALMWKIPRLRDRALNIMLGGKRIEPPPLASKMISSGPITAYFDKLESVDMDNEEQCGAWLTDAETGIRCAYAPAMQINGKAGLPYPLCWPGLTGDMLIPGLITQQRTDRLGLKPSFLKSKAWRDILDRLKLHISPFAQQLLGDQNLMKDDDPQTQLLHDLAQEFADVFGAGDIPDEDVIPGTQLPEPPGPKTPPNGKPGPGIHHGGSGPGAGPSKGHKGKRRSRGFSIGGKPYYFTFLPLENDHEVFAQISRNSSAICINPNYGIKRKNKLAQKDHVQYKVLETVAHHHDRDPDVARRLITRYLMQCDTKK